jgi:hypothetical protein
MSLGYPSRLASAPVLRGRAFELNEKTRHARDMNITARLTVGCELMISLTRSVAMNVRRP